MKTYYYIYRIGGDAPKIKHNTLEEAELESLRLAEKHPNASFEILQCLGTTRMTKPSTFWMDGVIPPHMCALNRAMDGTCFQCGDKEPEYRMLEEREVIEDGDEFTKGDDIWLRTQCGGSRFHRTSFRNGLGHHQHRRKLK